MKEALELASNVVAAWLITCVILSVAYLFAAKNWRQNP